VSKDKQIIVPVSLSGVFDKKTFQKAKKDAGKVELRPDLKTIPLRVGWILNRLVIFAIRIYQNTLGLVFPPSCRFYPSCSEYAIEAFRKFGLIKGGWLSVKRLSRCHPFNPGGFDPLP
jgi:putative membrane protein insertion efficiency factor